MAKMSQKKGTTDIALSQKQLVQIKNGIQKGLEVASGAKSSATYYHSREEQTKAIIDSVQGLYGISKELPLLLAMQKGATGFYIQQALLNELKQGSLNGATNIVNQELWFDEGLQDKAIATCLNNLEHENGTPYILRMLEGLRTNKINNSRSRRIALAWILGHSNLEFISIKYKNKLKTILTHAWGRKLTSIIYSVLNKSLSSRGAFTFKTLEFERFISPSIDKHLADNNATEVYKIIGHLFGVDLSKFRKTLTDLPLLQSWYVAKYDDVFEAKNIPVEILTGFLSDKEHPQHKSLWSTEPKRESTLAKLRTGNNATTENQKIRQTKKNESIGADVQVDMNRVTDFMALYKTGYETGFTKDITSRIDELAKKKKLNIPYDKVGIVVDCSLSMLGHSAESKNTPRAITDFTTLCIKHSVSDFALASTDGIASGLAEQFLLVAKAVEERGLEAIFILSDGYENEYEGLLNEVITAWKDISGIELPIYHVSPIVGSEVGMTVRKLSEHTSTIAINKPEALALQLNSKLIEQDIKAWLNQQVKQLKEI